METALNAVWDGSPRAGERIHVIGAGVVGCLVAICAAQIPGAEVTLADVLPERAALAEALGVAFATPDSLAATPTSSSTPAAMLTGCARRWPWPGMEARIVELSWYGSAEVALPLGEAFHSRRLTLQSSQVGQVAAVMRPRWSYARRLAKALDLLRDPCSTG